MAKQPELIGFADDTNMVQSYPEHEKLKAKQYEVGLIGSFIDFINEQQWELAAWNDKSEQLFPIHQRPDEIIGAFFEIDPKKIEAEKLVMLEEIRKSNRL